MKNNWMRLTSLVMTFIMLFVSPVAALAEQGTPTDLVATDTDLDVMPLGAVDLKVQEAMADQHMLAENAFEGAGMDGLDYADYYFSGAQTMHGIFSTISLYAELPDYAVAEKAILRLSYTASDLILSEYSSLTFYMNGTPFYSCQVQANGANVPTVLYIAVPVDLMKNGFNLLEIGAYIRLTDSEGCNDDFNGANWVKITDTTCLRVGYSLADKAGEIGMFPYPFISMMDKTGAQCAVTVSDKAETAELEAALTVMADLGVLVNVENEISFGRIGETDRDHVIYFGLRDNTPEHLLALLDGEVPPTGAVIRRASQDGKEYLLVVSREAAALLEAARFLADASRVEQAHSADAYVSVGESQTFMSAGQQKSLALEGQYTLKDILGHGASFSGPFHQSVTLYLPVAEDYALSSESRFSLNFRYSENLDFDRSLITVYWGNSIPLASKKLSKENAVGDTLTFAVPADAVGAASTYMVIAFDLEIKDLDCTPRQLNMPWAYVAEDSTFYFPAGEDVSLSLANRPAPFQRGSRLNDVLLVLSDNPTAEEMLLAGRTMSMLGAGSDPYGTLKVKYAKAFSASDADYNLIVIGMPASNGLLRQLNDKLFFRFSDDMTSVLSNDKIILDEGYASEVGTVQLMQSPYQEERAMLVLSAPAKAGILALTERVSEEEKSWELTKEAVLVDGHGKANAYQFTRMADTSEEEEVTFASVIIENRAPMLFMLTGMGCMLLLLLGLIIVLVRMRKGMKDEE